MSSLQQCSTVNRKMYYDQGRKMVYVSNKNKPTHWGIFNVLHPWCLTCDEAADIPYSCACTLNRYVAS